LESWARPIRISVLWLDNCSPASAKPLLTAVERFHSVYPEGIQILTPAATGPGCGMAAEHAVLGQDPKARLPGGDEYYATDMFGRRTMP
jgi:hypothetical protein